MFRFLDSYLRTRWLRRFRSRAELEAWQDAKVRRLLPQVVERSPFYRQWLGSDWKKDWREARPVDKAILMKNFDRWNTAAISLSEATDFAIDCERSRQFDRLLRGFTVGLSSGTSGHRGVFLVSERERATYLGTILAKILPRGGLLALRRQRVAFFLRADSPLYSGVQRAGLTYRFFDLLTPVAEHLSELANFEPSLLFGPPSVLRKLADAQAEGKISIRPARIFSVAETLDPLDQARIERAFGQKVHQIYQCTEGLLATTCEQGTLHLNEDHVVIEREYFGPSRTKFVPVITDVNRITQPMVRYRLNDILTGSTTPCACGSVFAALDQIEGRCDDLVEFTGADFEVRISVFPDFIRRAILIGSSEIEEYRVVQYRPGELRIALRGPAGWTDVQRTAVTESVRKEIEILARTLGAATPSLDFANPEELLNEPLGTRKLRRVERRQGQA